MTLKEHVREATTAYLWELVQRHRGDLGEVCREACISQATLYRRLPNAVKATRKKLAPAQRAHGPIPVYPPTLLRFFGVEVPDSQDFWRAVAGKHDVLMFDARKGYLAMVRRLHPDTGGAGANEERLRQVNEAWGRLEQVFRRHGWEG